MKTLPLFIIFLATCAGSYSQVRVDRSLINRNPSVVIYDNSNFGGASKELAEGSNNLADFNDIASSIKVPAGLCAIIYENADGGGGYGRSVDFLEDCPDLTRYNFNDITSYVTVFNAKKPGFVWIRNAMQNGQFVAGHWERERAGGALSANTVAVVSPPLPPHNIAGVTVKSINGPTTTITNLATMSGADAVTWESALKNQMGIIGNDFRGPEEIGSACFERESHSVIPDFINFWYPQKNKNDHRSIVFFKRTCSGKVVEAHQAQIEGTYPDYDVNIDIVPAPNYQYLVTEAHPREYTDIMAAQWKISGALPYMEQSGQPNCDDPKSVAESGQIEAEITEDNWPKGNHKFGRAVLADLCLERTGKDICLYGPWIYDRGHCCHAEIHPAEQIWWNEDQPTGKKYFLNVICDASQRFWWRKQMDDGTKLKPWGAPPIKGLFAIAFETVIGQPAKKFEVSNIGDYGVIEYPHADQTYNLIYDNNILVSFLPHNDAFKVSYEKVGLVEGTTNTVRGFLVIETSVGTCTQLTTKIPVLSGTTVTYVTIPENADPNKINQDYEDKFFRKVEGHYYFSIMETRSSVTPTKPRVMRSIN